MSEDKNATATAMQKIARQIQQALSQHGDPIAMGSEPTVVVYQANAAPGAPDDERSWHAAIVYRQHVAPTPARALASLGQTIFDAAARLDAQAAAENDAGEGPVPETPGGGVSLPDVWE